MSDAHYAKLRRILNDFGEENLRFCDTAKGLGEDLLATTQTETKSPKEMVEEELPAVVEFEGERIEADLSSEQKLETDKVETMGLFTRLKWAVGFGP